MFKVPEEFDFIMLYLYAPKYGDETLPLTDIRDNLDQFDIQKENIYFS